jgi:hypothetical protein
MERLSAKRALYIAGLEPLLVETLMIFYFTLWFTFSSEAILLRKTSVQN